ncbi:hypothetical protein MLD38_012929 [Melastoma candidum]|uniref:Uncharacterized protein n=1 Tax=Melastoma candidum TaxID=119954 RepID=A0ACB9R8I7_9MYRT|nr:hypothetical protein MLD38_012929 [Melastoma candidum]
MATVAVCPIAPPSSVSPRPSQTNSTGSGRVMCPPAAAAPLPDISEPCSDEELFMLLENFNRGGPLPRNVKRNFNPYHSKPEHLPVGIWYFIVLRNLGTGEHGAWKATGAPSRIFRNDSISGWRTTYEYHYQPSSKSPTADWLMEQYTITRNGKDDETLGEDASALCRIYRNCPPLIEQDLQQGHGLYYTSAGTLGNFAHMLGLDFISRQGEASTSYHQANDAEAAAIVARDDPLNRENASDAEGEDFEGDYLALSDLGSSPSSSSGNSSCVTMSPDECSATRGPQDTENKFIQDLEEKGHDHEFHMAPVKRDSIHSCGLLLGSSTDHANEEVPNKRAKTASYPHASTSSDETAGQTLPKQGTREELQNPWRNSATVRACVAHPSSSTSSSTSSNLPDRG